ncbi:MAG: dihydropteroate synthase [Bacteroidales bacterium]|nr:dihydropteroate synthase [Bacteroidales bacterium]
MGYKDTSFQKTRSIQVGKNILNFSRPKIMGILNLTPDSFYDGGRYFNEELWITQTHKMITEGADIIDLGAFSSRPGAEMVSSAEETERLLIPLKILKKEFPDVIFSIDTFRSEVAKTCVDSGADIINDISGGNMDSNMFSTVADLKVPYILMHMHGTPQDMQTHPISENITEKVRTFFERKVNELHDAGIEEIILDPGFGFGKTLECNYRLLAGMDQTRINNLPLLAGVSRKSMINKVLETKPEEALNGTTVMNTLALLKGADILRVHDVKQAKEAIELTSFYKIHRDETGSKNC